MGKIGGLSFNVYNIIITLCTSGVGGVPTSGFPVMSCAVVRVLIMVGCVDVATVA